MEIANKTSSHIHSARRFALVSVGNKYVRLHIPWHEQTKKKAVLYGGGGKAAQ